LHPHAQLAAQTSLCAAEQNRFWPIHDSLFAFFADKGELDGNTLAMLGEAAGLDPEALSACLQSGRVDPLIARDVAAADALGVDGTPALFLNGRPLRGGVSEQSLTDAIEEELARLGRTHP
jgi:protein-disulfide isomerase